MLHLPELTKQGQLIKELTLQDRLPEFINGPCHLKVTFDVKPEDNFYLMHLHVTGSLQIICQRCMEEFTSAYDNSTIIAVCRSEERADELQNLYECIVSSNWHVDLEELIVDELHLYAPSVHPEIHDCSDEINEILGEKNKKQ